MLMSMLSLRSQKILNQDCYKIMPPIPPPLTLLLNPNQKQNRSQNQNLMLKMREKVRVRIKATKKLGQLLQKNLRKAKHRSLKILLNNPTTHLPDAQEMVK